MTIVYFSGWMLEKRDGVFQRDIPRDFLRGKSNERNISKYLKISVDFSHDGWFNRRHQKGEWRDNPMSKESRRVFGYVRVSSKSQHVDRQREALLKRGVLARDIYVDTMSGRNFERPKYAEMKSQLQEGDLVVILDLDRLGRNYTEMASEWKYITDTKKCDIEVLNFPLLSTINEHEQLENRLIADIVLHLLSYVAERERKDILERQRDGIQIAKQNGVKFGRPKVPRPDNFSEVYQRVRNREITNVKAMEIMGLKPNCYYAFVRGENM